MEVLETDHLKESKKSRVIDVSHAFGVFRKVYGTFRQEHGLNRQIPPYEICTSMADKLGRICRQVKHTERNDPKPDWPVGITEDVVGLLVYTLLLSEHYDLDFSEGLKNELNKAIEQHGNGEG